MDPAPVYLDVAALRARVERRFRVYDVQSDDQVVAFYVDAPRDTLETEFAALKGELKAEGLIPLLKYSGGEHAIYVLRHPTRKRRSWKLNVVLYALTILTTTMAGAYYAFPYFNQDVATGSMTEMEYNLARFGPQSLLVGFVTFALPIMAILTIHEFGHYYYARKHGMDASLPFFIPFPPLTGLPTGTFGAFISMREPMPNRKALFDVGVAGPLAGLVATIVVLLVGLALMAGNPVIAEPSGEDSVQLGTPLLFDWLAAPFAVPDNAYLHPTAQAAWVGLLLTGINLLPAGQLDGGHIASAMFGDRARYASYAAVAGLLALGLAPMFGYPGYDGWLFFALLIGFLGVRHPPTLDGVSGIDATRTLVGWATFALGVLCFTIIPISG